MKDKKEYLKDMAREHWECGHPFSSDDFKYFQSICKEDGFDVDGKDWSYYWECFEDCRYNDSVQNYDMEDLTEAAGEKNARRRLWGPDWNNEYADTDTDTGVSNLDYFGNHLIEEIKANLKDITTKVGGKIKTADLDIDSSKLGIEFYDGFPKDELDDIKAVQLRLESDRPSITLEDAIMKLDRVPLRVARQKAREITEEIVKLNSKINNTDDTIEDTIDESLNEELVNNEAESKMRLLLQNLSFILY